MLEEPGHVAHGGTGRGNRVSIKLSNYKNKYFLYLHGFGGLIKVDTVFNKCYPFTINKIEGVSL